MRHDLRVADAGYSRTPLVRKLGIRPGHRLALLGAPEGFALDGLADVTVSRTARTGSAYDVIVLFCRDAAALRRRFARLALRLPDSGAVWVAWPKRTGPLAGDLTENEVRAHGLACGLVDVKVCAIDDAWSGLKFVRRLRDRRS
ncbi:MAG: hypothetical protein QOI42_2080 [Frankiaceae bacterium]|jgi:hypothetical protein|nr:hypothetical protein [Frankiaceae bacterium]